MQCKVGDRVRLVNLDVNGGSRHQIGKEGVIESVNKNSYYLRFDDGITYTVADSEIQALLKEAKGVSMPQQDIIKVHFKRQSQGDDSVIRIWVAPEVEQVFKRMSSEDGKTPNYAPSRKWRDQGEKPLKFYKLLSRIDTRMENSGHAVFNKYGSDLIDERNRCNIALLRTVGASEGEGISISTEEMLSIEDLRYYCETISTWCRTFYKGYIQEQEYEATITYEV